MSDTEVQADPATEAPADEQQPTPEAVAPSETEQDEAEPESFPRDYVEKLRKEAADRRKERDTLAAQVEALQRQQVEAAISLTGVKPQAVWAVTQLADLLSEDGTVSTELVAAAVQTARDQLGVQPITKGNMVPGVGNMPTQLPNVDRWSEAFAPNRR